MQVRLVQVCAGRLQEEIFLFRQRNVAELCELTLASCRKLRAPRVQLQLTRDLDLKPFKRGPGELLLRRAVLESVRDDDVREVLEDSALHRQLVEIGVEKGYDALRERRFPVEVHLGRFEVGGSGSAQRDGYEVSMDHSCIQRRDRYATRI